MLFRQAVGKIEPLVTDRLHLKPDEKPKPHPKRRSCEFESMPCAEYPAEAAQLGVGDALAYLARGLQKDALKRLRRGFFEVEAELDLHGLTAREAQHRLLGFLHGCMLDGLRCVHIIHGKGYRSLDGVPVLKNKINLWLRRHPDVLAFCSSNPADGGAGAVYVLLRSG